MVCAAWQCVQYRDCPRAGLAPYRTTTYTLSDASMFLLPFQNRVGDGGCENDVPGTHYVAGTYTHARQAQSTFNASEGYDNIYLRNGAALVRKL